MVHHTPTGDRPRCPPPVLAREPQNHPWFSCPGRSPTSRAGMHPAPYPDQRRLRKSVRPAPIARKALEGSGTGGVRMMTTSCAVFVTLWSSFVFTMA